MSDTYSQEELDQAVEDKTKELSEKVQKMEQQLNRFNTNSDDPFGPDWSPATAQDMGRDILKAVESKFPELAKTQQDQLVDAVLNKLDEKKNTELQEKKETEETRMQAQVDALKEIDKDLDEKKMWGFLKEYKGEQPKSVVEAYNLYKKEYKEPETEERIAEAPPKAEGTQAPQPQVTTNLDKAMDDAMQELGLNDV